MWFCYSASSAGRIHDRLPLQLQVGRVSWGFAILTFAYLTFWVGMRTGWGDTYAYNATFDNIESLYSSVVDILSRSPKGFGFQIITYIFHKYISNHLNVWYMFLALLSCGCVAYTFKRFSPNFFLSSLIYLLSCSFAWSMNGIRQYFCVTIIFACIPLILNRRWITLVIITLLLSFVHATALIMLPVYYVVKSKPWSKLMIYSVLITSCLVSFPGLFSSGVEVALEGSDYEGMTEKFGSGVNIIRVLFFSLPAVIAFLGRKKLSEQHNAVINLCINMSVLTACMYAIGAVTSGILMGRLPMYCQLFSYILIAFEAKLLFTTRSRAIFVWGYLALFFIFFTIQTAGGRYYYRSDITGLVL